jgi:hypothetical protein
LAGQEFEVYVIRGAQVLRDKPPGDAIRVEADEQGRVLFRDPVARGLIEDSFGKCISAAKVMLDKANNVAEGYEVESITLKLGLDAGIGVVFVGDASIKAAIEVAIKRKSSEGLGQRRSG